MKRLDVDAMLSEMSASQFTEWQAYGELEPFGSLRDDFRAAQVGAAIVNNIPLRGKGSRALKPADFFDSLAQPKKRQSKKAMLAAMKAFVLSMGGEFVTAGEKVGETGNG